ncbi:MAG: hypothetical protein LBR11_07740 [Deltaproteobacteria bacterium]|jgi:chromosome segregation ATPase|nr:hypothetical protein [Deltaproteobacteria bacterium]
MKTVAYIVTPLALIGLIVTLVLWRDSVSQVENLSLQLKRANDRIAALDSQTQEQDRQISSLTSNLKETETKLTRSEENLRARASEITRHQATINSLNAETTRLTTETARLTTEVKKMDEVQKQAELAQSEADVYRERLASQEAQLVVITQERDRLKAELEQAKKTINLLDLSSNEVIMSLGFLGRPVFEPDMLPPLINDKELY